MEINSRIDNKEKRIYTDNFPQKISVINSNLVKREDVIIDSIVREISIFDAAVSHRFLSRSQLISSQYL